MTYRFYNPAPVLLDLSGLKPLINGKLYFYEIGTTNLKDTYSDYEKTTPNPNPVPLSASGRVSLDLWLDGPYTVRIQGSDGTNITKDVRPEVDGGLVIPPQQAGKFLSTDGSNLLWQTVLQLPDPTGSNNQVPVTNGAGGYALVTLAQPVAPDPAIVVDAVHKLFEAGVSTNPKKWQVLRGDDSAPPSGLYTTTKAVVFYRKFKSPPHVLLTTIGSSQPGGCVFGYLDVVPTAEGFTARFDVLEGDTGNANVVNPVPFQWLAVGEVEAEEEEGGDDDPIPGDGGL